MNFKELYYPVSIFTVKSGKVDVLVRVESILSSRLGWQRVATLDENTYVYQLGNKWRDFLASGEVIPSLLSKKWGKYLAFLQLVVLLNEVSTNEGTHTEVTCGVTNSNMDGRMYGTYAQEALEEEFSPNFRYIPDGGYAYPKDHILNPKGFKKTWRKTAK
jgi:hypothetical protein